MLNRSALLGTSRGAGGGYRLVREPGEYSVGEILRATEGTMAPVACLEGELNVCPRSTECRTLFVWEGLYHSVNDYLDSITLQDILDHPSGGANYSI